MSLLTEVEAVWSKVTHIRIVTTLQTVQFLVSQVTNIRSYHAFFNNLLFLREEASYSRNLCFTEERLEHNGEVFTLICPASIY